jgi:hypothetical protein
MAHDEPLQTLINTLTLGRYWLVIRHGGHSHHHWRVLGSYVDEYNAVCRYDTENHSLRQGAIVLVNPDGTIAKDSSAPPLRTRW